MLRVLFAILPKQVKSNAIRRLECDDYFQTTVSIWPYVDRLDTSSRIEDVTSGEGLEAFRWRRHFTIRCKSLYIVPRYTVSAGPANCGAKSGSVISHAPRLNAL